MYESVSYIGTYYDQTVLVVWEADGVLLRLRQEATKCLQSYIYSHLIESDHISVAATVKSIELYRLQLLSARGGSFPWAAREHIIARMFPRLRVINQSDSVIFAANPGDAIQVPEGTRRPS